MSWFDRLRRGLKGTHERLVEQVSAAIGGKRHIDSELLDDLEAILISADLGAPAATQLIEGLRDRVRRDGAEGTDHLLEFLQHGLRQMVGSIEGELSLRTDGQPTVMLTMGINGSGKTTSAAKIAHHLRETGHQKVVLAAADTFRAAAVEQLEVWAERVGARLIKQRAGADPGAVAFDATDYAVKNGYDALIIDTAGRLHTKHNLMEELKKINRVVEKRLGRPIDERLLVLDATIGQNALSQAQLFNDAVPITGIVITKLDGTAKGGVIVPISKALGIPIKLIGVGEGQDDLRPFVSEEFIAAIFG